MSSRGKEDEVRIPEVIVDNKTNKKYQRGSFLGKVIRLRRYERASHLAVVAEPVPGCSAFVSSARDVPYVRVRALPQLKEFTFSDVRRVLFRRKVQKFETTANSPFLDLFVRTRLVFFFTRSFYHVGTCQCLQRYLC